MITHLPENTCANYGCNQKLQNGNCGGWKAQKLANGDWKDGYICKKCGNQSIPSTSQLRLYQQTQHYKTPTLEGFNITNQTINHKRQWANLTASLAKDDEKTNAPSNRKMPNWNKVLDRIEEKQKKEAKE